MGNVNINIRMDAQLKEEFKAFCDDMGMSMSTAFNLFAKKTVRSKRIPFEIGYDSVEEGLTEAILEGERIKKDPSLTKSYTNAQQMIEEVLADESI